MPDTDLKTHLEAIAAAGHRLKDPAELDGLLPAMLARLGDPDPVLRDDLIYTTLVRWGQSGMLRPVHLVRIYTTALDDNHLYFHLGESGGETVLTRSFSSLTIALCIYFHRQSPCLDRADLISGLERMLAYLPAEQDRRGYLPGLGWAHAVAHAADALDEYALCAEISPDNLVRILDVVGKAAAYPAFAYAHEEDERLSVAAVSAITRSLLSQAELEAWLARLVQSAETVTSTPESMYLRQNLKRFLRSIFFRLNRPEHRAVIKADLHRQLETQLLGMLGELTRF